MGLLSRFWRQPCRPYRNFQLVFTALKLNFMAPAVSYALFPEVAVAQYVRANQILGGAAYPFNELDSHFWRILAAANVMTLGFMCLLLQVNVRRFFPVLWPLVFMKALAALLWLGHAAARPDIPVFWGAGLLDVLTSGLFVVFAGRAHRAGATYAPQDLCPRPYPRP